jgi:hypothetical protein
MSYLEEILMEAWKLGINDEVMKTASEKHQKLKQEGKRWVDLNSLYEESLKEVKEQYKKK